MGGLGSRKHHVLHSAFVHWIQLRYWRGVGDVQLEPISCEKIPTMFPPLSVLIVLVQSIREFNPHANNDPRRFRGSSPSLIPVVFYVTMVQVRDVTTAALIRLQVAAAELRHYGSG